MKDQNAMSKQPEDLNTHQKKNFKEEKGEVKN